MNWAIWCKWGVKSFKSRLVGGKDCRYNMNENFVPILFYLLKYFLDKVAEYSGWVWRFVEEQDLNHSL